MSKKIKRIVVYYDDGTYEELNIEITPSIKPPKQDNNYPWKPSQPYYPPEHPQKPMWPTVPNPYYYRIGDPFAPVVTWCDSSKPKDK